MLRRSIRQWPIVASYLENKINNPIITDDRGQIYHPTISHSKQIDKRSIQIPTIVFRKEHLDSKTPHFITVLDVQILCFYYSRFTRLLCQTIAVIKEAKLAVKCYFKNI